MEIMEAILPHTTPCFVPGAKDVYAPGQQKSKVRRENSAVPWDSSLWKTPG